MAKRFTDTTKWKKSFIKGLQAKYKLLWFYILDDCDHAGVWEVDIEVASLRIGEPLTYEEAFIALGSQFECIGKSKWWIRDFIQFQYGKVTPRNKMYNPIRSILLRYNIPHNIEDLSPIDGVKVKDKVKVKEMDEGGTGGIEPPNDSPESLRDVEFWTAQVIEGNDPHFLNMVRGAGLILNGKLDRLARDHLGKSARYNWHEKQTTQQAFRHSLLNYIVENLNKNEPTKRTSATTGPEPNKDYREGF